MGIALSLGIFEHLLRQLRVGRRDGAFRVVLEDALSVGARLRSPHRQGHGGAEHAQRLPVAFAQRRVGHGGAVRIGHLRQVTGGVVGVVRGTPGVVRHFGQPAAAVGQVCDRLKRSRIRAAAAVDVHDDLHEPVAGRTLDRLPRAAAAAVRCVVGDFPVQHAFLYLHREAQSQLLPELFSGGNGVVAVDAHGPEGLQAAAGEGGDMAIQKNAMVGGSFNDGEHPLISGGDGVEIHDLA